MCTLRSATERDQETIRRRIRQARLNPLNLHGSRFVLAEQDRVTVGLRQIRVLQ